MSRHGSRGSIPEKPKDVKKTLIRLMYYLKPHLKGIITAVVFTVIATLASLYGAYAIKPVLNLIASKLNNEITLEVFSSNLMKELILLTLAFLSEVFLLFIASRIMLKVSETSMHQLREELYEHLIRLPIAYHDSKQHGELMSRFTNDINVLSETLGDTTRTFISNVLSLIGTLILMIWISPVMTIVVLGFMPVMVLVISFMGKKARKASKERQDSLGSLNGFIEESIEGITVNQLNNREEETLEEFIQFSDDFRRKSHISQAFSTAMMPLMQNLNMLLNAITAMVGGLFVLRGFITIGDLGSFVNMARSFGRPLNQISMQFATINSALSASERIFEVLDQAPESTDGELLSSETIDGHVELVDVDFGYVPENQVLHQVSFYAKPDQKIAIVGSTGSGKSTIINLIARFYDIDKGNILLDGKDTREYNRYILRQNIAMVLQDTHLFTGTIMENIRYGRLDATDQECIKAAKLSNAHHFIQNLENQYETVIRGDGEGLSIGQRQLLNIARAMVAKAEILILDEATSSIDTRTEELIEEGLDELMKGKTTFIIAHRLSTVVNSDAIIVLDKGRVIERGSHDELVEMGGVYAGLYAKQSEALV